jgi:hypothetical protein
MTISKKHFINIAKIIDDNSKHNDDDKQILVNALSNYFKSENKNFDSIRFYNACFKTFKPVSDDQKKAIKILQSKVKTYEADIEEANRKKLRSKLRSSNDLDKSKSLW